VSNQPEESAERCPICGVGTIADIGHDLDPSSREPAQRSDSREISAYSCGHSVAGSSLASADQVDLTVERRSSEETVNPGP